MKWRAAPLLLLLSLLIPPASSRGGSAAEAPIRLSVAPFYAPERIWSLYAPFVDFLRARTGQPWELRLFPDHETLSSALRSGGTDVVFLGPAPAARLLAGKEVRPVAVALGATGKPWYGSVVVTSDPAVRSLRDLRGKRFGYFEGSTAAHLVPLRLLEGAGVPRSEVTLVPFSGQDRIVEALLRREVDGAGIKEALYRKFAGGGLRVVGESGPLPNFAFYASPSLSPGQERRLLAALLSLSPRSRQEDRDLVARWDDEVRHGFVAPPEEFRASVLRLGGELDPATR